MDIREKTLTLLEEEVKKIEHLLLVQKNNLTLPQCPVYEEVVDTQMFGLSSTIQFLIRLELLSDEEGKKIMSNLEKKLSENVK